MFAPHPRPFERHWISCNFECNGGHDAAAVYAAVAFNVVIGVAVAAADVAIFVVVIIVIIQKYRIACRASHACSLLLFASVGGWLFGWPLCILDHFIVDEIPVVEIVYCSLQTNIGLCVDPSKALTK